MDILNKRMQATIENKIANNKIESGLSVCHIHLSNSINYFILKHFAWFIKNELLIPPPAQP